MTKNRITLLSMLFAFAPVSYALACGGVSPPRTITLSGASFSEKVSAVIESRCDSMRLFLTLRSENVENPSPANSLARFSITKNDPSCAAVGAEDCADGATVPVRAGGRVVAVIETSDTEAFLYSVNSRGNKDVAKPYFKFTKGERVGDGRRVRVAGADTLGPVVIRAYNDGNQIGEMSISGGSCGLRGGGGAPAQSGELDLAGKRFVSSAGCGGSSLTEQPFGASEPETDAGSDD